jgi:hypothetical protein
MRDGISEWSHARNILEIFIFFYENDYIIFDFRFDFRILGLRIMNAG